LYPELKVIVRESGNIELADLNKKHFMTLWLCVFTSQH